MLRKMKETGVMVSLGVIMAGIIALAASLQRVAANRYLSCRMFRLAALTVRETVTAYVAFFAAGLLLFGFVRLLLRRRSPLAADRCVRAGLADLTFLLALLLINWTLTSFTIYNWSYLAARSTALIANTVRGRGSWTGLAASFRTHFAGLLFLLAAAVLVPAAYLLLSRMSWGRLPSWVKRHSQSVRRLALVFIALLVLLNLGAFIDRRVNVPRSPNVILIVIDALRADHLGCYGYERETSPRIDGMLADSLLFTHAISTSPWTVPSIGSILTAQYPSALNIGEQAVRISSAFLTLAEVMREHNYQTAAIVSSTYVSSRLGFDQGFDSYDEGNAGGADRVSSASVTDQAVSFLQQRGTAPFFLFLHYFDPHNDYIMHEDYNFHPGYEGILRSGQPIGELRQAAREMSPDDVAYLRAAYDSEIRFTDEQVGRLLDALREAGRYDDTLIILTADHGEEFLERGDYWIGHDKKLYQELVHVPLIVKEPSSRGGGVRASCVSLIRLMPTILDSVGLKTPGNCGSAGGTILGKEGEGSRSEGVISETDRLASLRSVIWGGWKLIRNLRTGSRELFDLSRDPEETRNRAAEDRQVLERLEGLLHTWSREVEAQGSRLPSRPARFTPDQIDQLKSLGYL